MYRLSCAFIAVATFAITLAIGPGTNAEMTVSDLEAASVYGGCYKTNGTSPGECDIVERQNGRLTVTCTCPTQFPKFYKGKNKTEWGDPCGSCGSNIKMLKTNDKSCSPPKPSGPLQMASSS